MEKERKRFPSVIFVMLDRCSQFLSDWGTYICYHEERKKGILPGDVCDTVHIL